MKLQNLLLNRHTFPTPFDSHSDRNGGLSMSMRADATHLGGTRRDDNSLCTRRPKKAVMAAGECTMLENGG